MTFRSKSLKVSYEGELVEPKRFKDSFFKNSFYSINGLYFYQIIFSTEHIHWATGITYIILFVISISSIKYPLPFKWRKEWVHTFSKQMQY